MYIPIMSYTPFLVFLTTGFEWVSVLSKYKGGRSHLVGTLRIPHEFAYKGVIIQV